MRRVGTTDRFGPDWGVSRVLFAGLNGVVSTVEGVGVGLGEELVKDRRPLGR